MPDRLAYDEAMLFSAARLKITDPEIKQGKVATLTTQTTLGPVERPWGIEGGFAVVYKFITLSGQPRALRCFRVPIDADMRFRYERIGAFFRAHVPAITVDSHYYADSLIVKEQGVQPPRAYPVIDMEWVDGLTLLETVDACCRHQDIPRLQRLVQQWLELLALMRHCGMAHGDLAAVNVMCREDGRLALVDYDGVYIPEFGPTAANLKRVLLGQPDYQHPQMADRPFNATMDDFSALVIYTALLALSLRPGLWETYAKRDAQGRLLDTNLLFTRQDYKEPAHSSLLQTLMQLNDPQLTAAVSTLWHACQQPIEQVRFPWQLVEQPHEYKVAPPPTQPEVVPTVVPNPPVERRTIPNAHTITSASQRPLTRPAVSRTQRERERQLSEQTVAFRQVCQSDDDEAIASAYEEISNFGHFDVQTFPEELLQRARLAQQRRSALARFRIAIANKRPLQIAAAYDAPLLNESQNVTPMEREILLLARAFQQAHGADNREALLAAYDAIQTSKYQRNFIFSAQELSLLNEVRSYLLMKQDILQGIASDNDARIRHAYQPALKQHLAAFSPWQQQRIAGAIAATEIERALAERDYAAALLCAWPLKALQFSKINCFKLQKAALRFIRQQDLSLLSAKVRRRNDTTYLSLNWRWPDHPLVQHAVIVWSSERWPPRLANHVPHMTGDSLLWVQRIEGQSQGSCEIALDETAGSSVYIQGYSALLDPWDKDERWFFADGCTASSRDKIAVTVSL
ncbi:protein kinase family protein [Dictyobacter kobayashii]|uniref:Protein kinase domain-containing protein n=1 Tax=Dictyobacter kobayashii TaxID=2014872 RepID=A0A402AHJ6_9CHLR|nr:protein kinase family protein [Dictyobacter kobayashii]GCE18588.1 hypothetical protein KDK_23880 [Dictyobacter kobayashii]